MKKYLSYIILFIVILVIIILNNIITNKDVTTCINNGQKTDICYELYN